MATGSGRRYDREVEPDRPWSLEAGVAETRAEVRGLRSEVGELRAEVRSVRSELRSEIGELRSEVRSDTGEFRTEVRSDTGEFRTEVRSDIAELRHDLRRLDDRFFQMLVLQVGTLLAALGSLVSALLS
jgi:uncharacterized coiled-coil DUF342 family protein